MPSAANVRLKPLGEPSASASMAVDRSQYKAKGRGRRDAKRPKPQWDTSQTTFGLHAASKEPTGGQFDIYIKGGNNRAGEFSRAFKQAHEDLSATQKLAKDQRQGKHAASMLSRTLSDFGGPVRSGDRFVIPGSRSHTREFCVPTIDTHKVFMGYVDPVDLAHSMTAGGFNVRGVNLPLIGQPVDNPHQGLARQPRPDNIMAAQARWSSQWGDGKAMAARRSQSVLETRQELDEFDRRMHDTAQSAAEIATAEQEGAQRPPKSRFVDGAALSGVAEGGVASTSTADSVSGRWRAVVTRRNGDAVELELNLRAAKLKATTTAIGGGAGRQQQQRVSGAGKQHQAGGGKPWLCRVSSGKFNPTSGHLRLQLNFGGNDIESWQGDSSPPKLKEGQDEHKRADAGAGADGSVEFTMVSRRYGWSSPPFALSRAPHTPAAASSSLDPATAETAIDAKAQLGGCESNAVEAPVLPVL